MKYTVFGKTGCPYCIKATSLLLDFGKEFRYFNVEEHPEYLEELLKLKPNARTVPQIFDVDGRHIGGYEELYKEIYLEDLDLDMEFE